MNFDSIQLIEKKIEFLISHGKELKEQKSLLEQKVADLEKKNQQLTDDLATLNSEAAELRSHARNPEEEEEIRRRLEGILERLSEFDQ